MRASLLTIISIGNGWAAAGMLRVAQTMNSSIHAQELVQQSSDLTNWINEILNGVWPYQVSLLTPSTFMQLT